MTGSMWQRYLYGVLVWIAVHMLDIPDDEAGDYVLRRLEELP